MTINPGESLSVARKEIINAMEEERVETERKIAELIAKKNAKEEDKREAAKNGDLSENAEYHNAVEELVAITEQLSNLSVISEAYKSPVYNALIAPTDRDYIDVGTIVRLRHHSGKEFIWMLVPSEFARIENNTLSSRSPAGSHLVGMTAGESFTINIKGSTLHYTIEEVL